MKASRKNLWLSTLISTTLLISMSYYSYHLFSHKNIDDIYLPAHKYDVYEQGIHSSDNLSELKEILLLQISTEKELAGIMSEYFDLMFRASAVLLFLACLSSGYWFMCARAFEKECAVRLK